MRYRSTLFALLLLLAPTASSAQSYAIQGTEHYFRLEWEATTARRGPVISGYVYNLSGTTADRMRLAIDLLDGSGQVTASEIGYVFGTVPAGNRAYFEVPVRRAENYRCACFPSTRSDAGSSAKPRVCPSFFRSSVAARDP